MAGNDNIQSASEVLSYRGNAANAGGYDAQGSPIANGNSVAPLLDVIKTLGQQQFQTDLVKYNQAVKDRDESLAMMADPTLNIDVDVLDDDRPALEKQLNVVRDTWLKDPNVTANPEAFVAMKKETKKFTEMAASAKSRSLESKKLLGEIAKEPNKVYRERMIAHLDSQKKKGVLGTIDPYFKDYTIDAEKMFPKIEATAIGNPEFMQGEDGAAYATQLYGVRPEQIKNRFSPASLLADENDHLLQDVQIAHQNFVQSDFAKDPAFMQHVNSVTDKINKDWGLKEGDELYFKPAFKKVGDSWEVTGSPAELAQALYAKEYYKYEKRTGLSEDYQKQMKTKAEIGKLNADAWNARTVGAAQAQKYRAEADKALKEGRHEDAKIAKLKSEGAQPVSDLVSTFHNLNDLTYKPMGDFTKTATNTLGGGLLKGVVPTIANNVKSKLGVDDTWQFAQVPKTNQGAIKMLSVAQTNEKGEITGGAIKPSYIVSVKSPDGDINKTRLVGLDRNGNVMKVVNPEQGLTEIIKFENGFKSSSRTVEVEGAARMVVEDYQGSGKQGLDLNAIIGNKGVTDTQPLEAGQYDETQRLDGKVFYRKGDQWFDSNGKPVS